MWNNYLEGWKLFGHMKFQVSDMLWGIAPTTATPHLQSYLNFSNQPNLVHNHDTITDYGFLQHMLSLANIKHCKKTKIKRLHMDTSNSIAYERGDYL